MVSQRNKQAKQIADSQRIIGQQTTEIAELRSSNQELDQRVKAAGDELDRRLAESQALSQVAAAISSVMEVQPLLEMIMGKSKEVMYAEASSLMLLDEETQELVFNVATGEKGAAIKEIRLPLGVGIAGWVAQNRVPLLIPDAYEDPRFNPEADKRSGFRTRSIVCVPLMIQERNLGVVQVLNPTNKESFQEDDLRTFTSFADNAAIAIENARLYEEIKQKAEELREALERERWLTLQRDKLGEYVPKSVVQEIERDREQALALRFWGLNAQEYYDVADVWPLDPDGEVLLLGIVEEAQGVKQYKGHRARGEGHRRDLGGAGRHVRLHGQAWQLLRSRGAGGTIARPGCLQRVRRPLRGGRHRPGCGAADRAGLSHHHCSAEDCHRCPGCRKESDRALRGNASLEGSPHPSLMVY